MHALAVVLDIPTRAIDKPYTYSVPEKLEGEVGLGCAVLVTFSGRPAVGYVVDDRVTAPEGLHVKPIEAVLARALFDREAAELAAWIAREYAASLADAVRLLLPPGGRARAVKEGGSWRLERPAVSGLERLLVRAVQGCDYVPRGGATSQRAVLQALADGPVFLTELRSQLGDVSSAVKKLQEVGAVTVEKAPLRREPRCATEGAQGRPELSSAQRAALSAVVAAPPGSVIVLDGVTGSGKTEVYLQAIESTLADGRGALVLVPEISLTPQTVGRFRARFGDRVAVLHSRLSAGERYDEWYRVLNGQADVVVGARSALFAPLRDVGIVVIDEEHESSYKQGSAPRYHARDVAARMAQARRCVLVLGSATPSLEAMSACERGEWKRIHLPDRVTGAPLPRVEVVDMGIEFREGHRSMFSRRLLRELTDLAREGGKAILLLNRRGYASFLLCRECGYVPTCDQCSISMTYHERSAVLACHHCDARRPVPAACPGCGGPYLRVVGAGTQRVESELALAFPGLPVIRMDADTTTGKGSHDRILARFSGLDSGVLVGTQMIAKGLDFPDVSLVGVLNADLTLHLPDFRAAERTFQLIAQVAGRAGRGASQGLVIVQSYWPTHPAIRAAAVHDAASFYRHEIIARRELGYPPSGRIAHVIVSGRDDAAAQQRSGDVARRIRESLPSDWVVLGPSRAPLARLRGSYRWHLLVKAPVGAPLGERLAAALAGESGIPGTTLAIDVDPTDVL